MVFQKASKKFQRSFKEVPKKFQGSFKVFSRKIEIYFETALKVIKRIFKCVISDVSRIFEKRCKGVSLNSGGGLVSLTIMWSVRFVNIPILTVAKDLAIKVGCYRKSACDFFTLVRFSLFSSRGPIGVILQRIVFFLVHIFCQYPKLILAHSLSYFFL